MCGVRTAGADKSDRQKLATGVPLPVRAEQLREGSAISETVAAKCQAELVELEQELTLLLQRESLLQEQALVP
jgi:hypothetical protein